MYLADTSVWIDAQRPSPRGKGQVLRRLVQEGVTVGLTGIVLQELLQGARDEAAFRKLWRLLETRRRYESTAPDRLVIEAAHLYARCRWQGYTVRKSNDCLIARIAIENHLILLQDDSDFEHIARVDPRLKLA